MYLSLEKIESHQEFWRSLLIVSSSSLEGLREERQMGIIAYAAQTRANQTVKAEITRLLSGKSFDQLVQLQSQVQRKLSSGEVVDVDYWEGLLKELVVWKAKAKLRDMHEVVLSNRLEQLRKKQRDEAIKYAQEVKTVLQQPEDEPEEEEEEPQAEEEMELEDDDEFKTPAFVAQEWDDAWEPPVLKSIPESYRTCQVIEASDDRQKLVRSVPLCFSEVTSKLTFCSISTLLVVPSLKLASSRNLVPVLRTLKLGSRTKTKRFTKPRSDKDSTKRKSCSTSRSKCPNRPTRGKTSTDRGNLGTSTRFTRVTSGTSTTKLITSE